VQYLLDPRVLQIGYSVVDEFEVGEEIRAVREKGLVDGKVIGYICKNRRNGKGLYVVDSIEGGHYFRPWMEKNFKLIYDDILRVAKDIGAKEVLFDLEDSSCSDTTRKVLSIFKEKIWKGEKKVKEIKTDIIGSEEIPYTNGEKQHYL
jgi:hypothetical protein